MKLRIICTSDETYLPVLRVFLNSLNQNSNIEYTVTVRLINCDNIPSFLMGHDTIIDNKHLSTKRDKLIDEGLPLNDFTSDMKVKRNSRSIYSGARWLYSDKMAYCANIKFNTINKLLSLGDDYIFYFDADTIIRHDISPLVHLLKSHDILIRKTPSNSDKPLSEPYEHLYHTGMIGIQNNNKTRRFFKRLEANVNDSDFFNWDTDQIEFANITERDQFNIDISNIEEKYKDETFKDSSHIWCGAAAGKVSNEKYIEEMIKYDDTSKQL